MEATETITTSQPAGTKTFVMRLTSYLPVTAIGFAGALVLLWRLGSGSLDDWDEPIYAQISKDIA